MATFELKMVSKLDPDGAYGRNLLLKDLNNYDFFFCTQEHNFYVITVIYVIYSITPNKIN